LCSESGFVALHHQIIGAGQRARLYSIDASLDADHIQNGPDSDEVSGRNVHPLSLDVANV
jgi:hypothetical protein